MNNKCIFLISMAWTLCQAPSTTDGSNILVLLPTYSSSHLIIEMAVARAMAESNHNVTVVSALPLKAEWLHSSMTYIHLDTGALPAEVVINSTKGTKWDRMWSSVTLLDVNSQKMADMVDDPKMQELMYNRGNQFDLLLYGYLFGEFWFGLGEHFNCPLALLWPNVPMIPIIQYIGNPLEMSYTMVSIFNSVAHDGGFLFRLENLIAGAAEYLLHRSQHRHNKEVYEKHFPADKYVSFDKAKERVAMILYSHHYTEKPVRPLVPALIEIGGIHLNEEPKPLPKDIADFIDSAEHGVIFFSLGTNVKVNHLQDQTLDKLYNVLSKLPQKVLWKCDDESKVPGNSTNILYRKWLPQADILGHPNVKLFFGHGGKGGITEAKFYGVPMVGLPVFADQPINMEEVVTKGYGLSINHDEPLTETIIYKTVIEVLQNTTYANNVKRFSTLYRDRPLKIKENAVYWLEYLIRHKGAPHLQSPLKTMSFIETTNLDVFALLLLVFYLSLQTIRYFTKLSLNLICCGFRCKSKVD